VLIEFWVVATRPIEVNGLGMTAEATDEAITDILTISAVADEPNDMATRWREMAVRYGPKGKICHDLRIVALASAHGIDEILTLNQGDLGRFAEVRSVGPNMARTTTGSGDVSG
jgi:predicted nucleic acid-binding protein